MCRFCSKAQELYQLIEGQNTTLCKLQEMAHHSQLAQSKVKLLTCFLIKNVNAVLSVKTCCVFDLGLWSFLSSGSGRS